MILNMERPFDSHQASGKQISSNISVVMLANFNVSHIGDSSIKRRYILVSYHAIS